MIVTTQDCMIIRDLNCFVHRLSIIEFKYINPLVIEEEFCNWITVVGWRFEIKLEKVSFGLTIN